MAVECHPGLAEGGLSWPLTCDSTEQRSASVPVNRCAVCRRWTGFDVIGWHGLPVRSVGVVLLAGLLESPESAWFARSNLT